MSLSLLLAQRFFKAQYQQAALSRQQLWEYYGPQALSGCQLWDEASSFETAEYETKIAAHLQREVDWAEMIQHERNDRLHQQYFAQFFSPPSAIEHILDELPHDRNNYLDPSCGAGCFLIHLWLRLEKKGEHPKDIISKIYGVDLDPDLVALTRFRLFQKADWDPILGAIISKNIQCGDSLLYPKNNLFPPKDLNPINWKTRFPHIFSLDKSKSGFQVIIGNPPFLFLSGRGSPVKKLRKIGKTNEADKLEKRLQLYKILHPQASKGCADLYKYFAEACCDIRASEGMMGLIFPSSWIRLSRYENMRQLLLQNQLYRLEEFGQTHFPRLVVPSSIIFCGRSRKNIQYIDHQKNRSISFPPKMPFPLYQTALTEKLFFLAKLTLADICTIREGLHDYSYMKGEKQRIGNFVLSTLKAFQAPSIEMIPVPQKFNRLRHSSPRVILRKTGDSLVGALIRDPSCCLTHQNCYVLHPKNNFSPEALEILINAKIITYLYQNSPAGQKGRVMAQLRIEGLKRLPLPQSLSQTRIQRRLIQAHLEQKTDDFIVNLFALSPKEQQEITEAISS